MKQVGKKMETDQEKAERIFFNNIRKTIADGLIYEMDDIELYFYKPNKERFLNELLPLTSIDRETLKGKVKFSEQAGLMRFIDENKNDLLKLKLIPSTYRRKSIDDVKEPKKLIKCLFSKFDINLKNSQYRIGKDRRRELVVV